MRRIYKKLPLSLPDHAAQAVYRGDLMLGDHGLVYDPTDNEWYEPELWPPRRDED